MRTPVYGWQRKSICKTLGGLIKYQDMNVMKTLLKLNQKELNLYKRLLHPLLENHLIIW